MSGISLAVCVVGKLLENRPVGLAGSAGWSLEARVTLEKMFRVGAVWLLEPDPEKRFVVGVV